MAHSHPVMLVFCQLLIKGNKGLGLEESLPEIQPRESDVESGEGSCTYFLVIYVNSKAAFLTPSSRQNLVHAQNSDFRQLLFSFLLLFRTINLTLFVLKHLLTSSQKHRSNEREFKFSISRCKGLRVC